VFCRRAANGSSLLKAQRRHQMRAIKEATDVLGMVHRTHTGIMGTFVQFLREKSDITVLDDHCVYELGK